MILDDTPQLKALMHAADGTLTYLLDEIETLELRGACPLRPETIEAVKVARRTVLDELEGVHRPVSYDLAKAVSAATELARKYRAEHPDQPVDLNEGVPLDIYHLFEEATGTVYNPRHEQHEQDVLVISSAYENKIKAMSWVIDPECGVMEDDGNPGGDRQVGNAASIRFVRPDLPNARITVYAYAEAPEQIEGDVECPHEAVVLEDLGDGIVRYAPMPDEHVACTHDLSALGVDALTVLEILDADGEPDWEHRTIETLDTFPLGRDVAKAEAVALAWIKTLDPERDLKWNGKEF